MSEESVSNQEQNFHRRSDDFTTAYSNNFQLEQTVFDLRIIFGELAQSEGKSYVEQHTSVTIPWIQVKLLSYFLQVNLLGYESLHGKIKIPEELIPQVVTKPSTETDPKVLAIFELISKLREQFVSDL